MAVFITTRPGVTPAAARRSRGEVTAALNRPSDPNAPVSGVVSALRPAEIANYRTARSTPAALAAVLAAAAISALGLTLIASVRRRRREFALLKTLGFTQRQLAATVAWQSSVPAIIGVIFGLPLGIAIGRWLWTLFAWGISAIPRPQRARAVHGCSRARRDSVRQPRSRIPRTYRRPHAHRAALAGRVAGTGRPGQHHRVLPEHA